MSDEVTNNTSALDVVEKAAQAAIAEKARSFEGMLEDIENLDDKKKRLWREIYENAIIDRQHAYACYQQLLNVCQEKSHEWAIHGRTLSSYIERMAKANDQVIKLADLIAREQARNEAVNPEDLYNQIQGK